MLPRTTQQSHSAALGRESQIEPWLAIANTLLAGAKARSERRNQDAAATDSRSSTKSCRRRGAGSQKKTPLSKEEECFFLTSPFIEPGVAGRQRFEILDPVFNLSAFTSGAEARYNS